jgi:hypothetical protein
MLATSFQRVALADENALGKRKKAKQPKSYTPLNVQRVSQQIEINAFIQTCFSKRNVHHV